MPGAGNKQKREMNMDFGVKIMGGLLVIAIVLALGLIGNGELADESVQVNHYCKMVRDFKSSGGELGWPAYKGESMCSGR